MRHYLKRAVLAAVAGMAGVAPGADEIKLYAWTRGDARPTTATMTYDSGEDIDITVDGSVTIIQIIADDPTSQSIGHVLIRSDRSASNALRLLIADEDMTDFNSQPITPMSEGCLHWAGVHALDVGSSSGTEGQNTATGNSLLVAAAIHGNFAQGSSSEGRIEAGHIYRLESEGTVSGGGNLTIPVWAYGEGFIQDGNPFHTIGVVHVSNSITNTIRADNTSTVFTYQFHDIGRIRVGPSTSAAGISGRILCLKGSISQITSTGPINITTTGTDAGILAGSRIELIYAGEEGVSVPTVARDISARVVCKKLDSQGQPTVGTLRKLRTAGDLYLPVDVVDIAPPSDFVACNEDYGIWVKGEVKKPINVAHHVRVAVIRGGTFADDADVTIGWYLKGTVEATDSDGVLRHVSVGRGAGTPGVTRGINGWEGACGIDQYVDPDSIIRAKTIEWADVPRMYLHYDKNRAPRIEADTINLLTINEMITGEVRGHATGADAYAVIGVAEIGNIFGGVPSISGAGPALVRCETFTTFDVSAGMAATCISRPFPPPEPFASAAA
ncbi:MAG: hypothetical protein JNK25_11200 [Phycisphaerae bacterium]|nr:hypothetical protein [Phycisphaerae bacterium]